MKPNVWYVLMKTLIAETKNIGKTNLKTHKFENNCHSACRDRTTQWGITVNCK